MNAFAVTQCFVWQRVQKCKLKILLYMKEVSVQIAYMIYILILLNGKYN